MAHLEYVLIAFATIRILIGLAAIVGLSLVERFRVPPSENTALARLMARLFGIRDAALGVLIFWALANPSALSFVLLFNAAVDFSDAAAISVPLIKREGIDLFAKLSLALALSAGSAWTILWWLKFACHACVHTAPN